MLGAWNATTKVRRLEDIPIVPSFRRGTQVPIRRFLLRCISFDTEEARQKMAVLTWLPLVQAGQQLPDHVQRLPNVFSIGGIRTHLQIVRQVLCRPYILVEV